MPRRFLTDISAIQLTRLGTALNFVETLYGLDRPIDEARFGSAPQELRLRGLDGRAGYCLRPDNGRRFGVAVRLGGASIMNVRPSLPPIAAQHDMAKRAACGHDYPVEGADDHGATEPVAKAPLDAD
jgi:hypothetical protein